MLFHEISQSRKALKPGRPGRMVRMIDGPHRAGYKTPFAKRRMPKREWPVWKNHLK